MTCDSRHYHCLCLPLVSSSDYVRATTLRRRPPSTLGVGGWCYASNVIRKLLGRRVPAHAICGQRVGNFPGQLDFVPDGKRKIGY